MVALNMMLCLRRAVVNALSKPHASQGEGVLVTNRFSRIFKGSGFIAQTTTATLHLSPSITDNADYYEMRKEAGLVLVLSKAIVESLSA